MEVVKTLLQLWWSVSEVGGLWLSAVMPSGDWVSLSTWQLHPSRHLSRNAHTHQKDDNHAEMRGRIEAPVSPTHQRHVTCQGQNLVSKPHHQIWGCHTWAGKLYNIRPCMVWHMKMLSVSMMLWVLTLVWVVSRDAVVDGRKRRSLILGEGVSWEGEMGGRA